MPMIDESALDNILVAQKNLIIERINSAVVTKDAKGKLYSRELHDACTMLNVVRALWYACSYGYKYTEVQKRITDKFLEIP